MRRVLQIAERLGGMTAMELAERIDEGEVELWAIEDMLRIEDTRYAQMDARLKAKVSG